MNARISAGLCPFSVIFSANESVFRAEHEVKRLRSTQKSLLPIKNARSEGAHKSETSEKHQTIISHWYLPPGLYILQRLPLCDSNATSMVGLG